MGLENWIEQEYENCLDSSTCIKLEYFIRKMKVCNACIKDYNAHIFVVYFESEQQMKNNWESVNNYVAINFQSKVESIIEKSNFYICCFVDANVNNETKHRIEDDAFCAKKYIFETKEKDINECCKYIEKRIFTITMECNNNNSAKLMGIELKNFRAYDGRVNISFQDEKKSPASFVAIYAKNGVGKTSLIDGVEFALKGEVSRFEELEGRIKGAVYRNASNCEDESYVKLDLNNGRRILRKVRRVRPDGNDIYRNRPTEGKDIVGDRKQWLQTLLPHHKIDSFISAKSPWEQYKEWVESTQALECEREQFVTAHNRIKKIKKEINDIEGGQRNIREAVLKLEKDKEESSTFRNLLFEFNDISSDRKFEYKEDFGVKEYDETINKIKDYKKEINAIKSQVAGNIAITQGILSTGVEVWQEKIGRIEECKKILLENQEKENRKLQLEVLLRKKSEKEHQIEEINIKLEPINNIEKYGIEEVYNAVNTYKEAENEIKISGNRVLIYMKEKEKKEECIREKYNEISILDREINTLKKERINEIGTEFIVNRNKINEEELEIYKAETDLLLMEKEKSLIEQEICDIENFDFSEKIDDLQLEGIINVVLGDEWLKVLREIKKEYLSYTKQFEKCKEQIRNLEKNEKELEELKNIAQVFLLKHHNMRICPVCNTNFEDWESLFKRANHIQIENSNIIEEQMNKIIFDINELKEKYELIRLECINVKKQKLITCWNQNNNLVVKISKKQTYIDKAKKRIEKFQDKNELIKRELERYEINYNEISKESILQAWTQRERKIRSKIEADKILVEEYDEAIRAIQNAKKDEERKINRYDRVKSKIVCNTDLYNCVKYLLNQTDGYKLAIHKKELNEQLNDYERERDKLNERIKTYEDVAYIDKVILAEGRKYAERIYEESRGMQENCKIFSEFTEEGIKCTLAEWNINNEYLGRQIELLEKMEQENGARNYYKFYVEYKKESDKLEKQYNQKISVLEDAQKDFACKKKNLEKKLSEYFNQSGINEIYRKIDPHDVMKNVSYNLSFDENDEPQLFIQVNNLSEDGGYRPEWYFSTAQLNTVAFSSFFSRAITASNIPICTIFVDDPIGHFDDMNILGFADLMRSVLENNDGQIVITTHDEKVFRILERKLDPNYYSSCFIRLPNSKAITRQN